MPEPAAGVMRMSADDDDQADQQHELADGGDRPFSAGNVVTASNVFVLKKRKNENRILKRSRKISKNENGK